MVHHLHVWMQHLRGRFRQPDVCRKCVRKNVRRKLRRSRLLWHLVGRHALIRVQP